MNRRLAVAGLGAAMLATAGGIAWALTSRESPEHAWDEIQAAACEGSVDGFYSRVDWGSIARLAIKRAASDNPLATVVGERAMEKVRQEWDDDIRLGSAGAWCQATRTDSDREKRIVYWSTPSGKTKVGRFDRSGGKYILIDVLNE